MRLRVKLRRARPPRHEHDLVVFMADVRLRQVHHRPRVYRDALAERGDRTVSLLDGDHVRHLLSAGLTFSRADRDLNIARIGYVAAEIARHGGIAICAPIAPYERARAAARQMVPRPATSCSCTSPRRSRSARRGTARACTPRPGRADRGVHRGVGPVRGAARRRPGARHVGHDQAGGGRSRSGAAATGGWLADAPDERLDPGGPGR